MNYGEVSLLERRKLLTFVASATLEIFHILAFEIEVGEQDNLFLLKLA